MRKRRFGYRVKAENVIGRLCCWSCQTTEKQLLRCPDIETYIDRTMKNGDIAVKIKKIKSLDYICIDCIPKRGRVSPPIGNVSTQYFKKDD